MMPPWPFNDPFAGVAVILLLAGAIGWLDDRIEAFRAAIAAGEGCRD